MLGSSFFFFISPSGEQPASVCLCFYGLTGWKLTSEVRRTDDVFLWLSVEVLLILMKLTVSDVKCNIMES